MTVVLSDPAPGRPISSRWGWRIDPILRIPRKHRGIDRPGTFPVLAAAPGTVVEVLASMSKLNGYGYGLIIRHDNGLHTLYAHGKARPKFQVGDRVQRAQQLFISGSTGASTGDHLHFEVRTSRAWGTDINPEPLLFPPAPADPTPSTLGRRRRSWALG